MEDTLIVSIASQFINGSLQQVTIASIPNSQNIKQINLMIPTPRPTELQAKKQYYEELIRVQPRRAIPLNNSLFSNPFLKEQESFHFLGYMLSEYNKRIKSGEITDPYEIMCYERLHLLMCDLCQMEARQDQVARLKEVFEWFRGQSHLIDQRKNQGAIRYKVSNSQRHREKEPEKESEIAEDPNKYLIPSELIQRLTGPYSVKSRTVHKELDIPSKRLNEYKRKIINIAPFIDAKEQTKPARVLYPMPQKVEQLKDEDGQQQHQEGSQQIGQDGQPIPPKEGQEGQLQEGENKEDPNDQQDSGGGFGQEKEEPDQEQPLQEQGNDKLAPKNKIYASAVTPPKDERKYYRAPYLHYRAEESLAERTMEERYKKWNQDKLKKQNEEHEFIELAHYWGRDKSKVQKQLNKKLQNMVFKPKYSLSQEPVGKVERLNPEDQLRYGLTVPIRKVNTKMDIDLTRGSLPAIEGPQWKEKSLRKDRLQSLKNKFGKMLNLSQYQERETAPSLCQYTSRRRDLSEIIRAHSKSKERLNQLEEIARIKEKMTRGKVGINMRALSQGLVLPEQEQLPANITFPTKELLNNPFWAEATKKKKKKK